MFARLIQELSSYLPSWKTLERRDNSRHHHNLVRFVCLHACFSLSIYIYIYIDIFFLVSVYIYTYVL